jgi:ABC-type Mn2+/Zn2+ transport system permease subunit
MTMASFATLFDTYRDAWASVTLIALACSIVSIYVVVRRVTFLSVATAQIAAAGVAVAFLFDAPPLPFAIAATVAGVALFSFGRESYRISRDVVVGVGYAAASALAVLCVFRSSQELDHIEHIVYGSLLFATPAHVAWLAGGAAIVVAIHAAFAREFVLVSFDPDTAHTLGVRSRTFQCLLAATIALSIALSIGTAGSLLTFSFLVLPAATALLLTERLKTAFALSIVTGIVTALGGLAAAVLHDSPPGPTIVLAGALLLGCAALVRIRAWLGALALAAIVVATLVFAPDHAGRGAAADAAGAKREGLKVELHAMSLTSPVRRGELLRIATHAHIHGDAGSGLHVLLELGDQRAAARLPDDGGDVIVDLEVPALAAGKASVVVTVWTGPPLAPDDATRPLDASESNEVVVQIEVEP